MRWCTAKRIWVFIYEKSDPLSRKKGRTTRTTAIPGALSNRRDDCFDETALEKRRRDGTSELVATTEEAICNRRTNTSRLKGRESHLDEQPGPPMAFSNRREDH
ncbi:hypothetical protein Trydic_g12527 [Trypoxylus dichotomus]